LLNARPRRVWRGLWSRRWGGHWSRYWSGLRCRHWSGLRGRHWSRPARQHPDIRAIDELLATIIAHGLIRRRRAARRAREPPMKDSSVPPGRLELVPVAAIISQRHTTVRCPPAPLKCALLARQAFRDDVSECVCYGARWQVEALWVQVVNRLAVSIIIRTAVSGGLCTHQIPLEHASRIRVGAIADRHRQVTEMMRGDPMFELDHLASSVGPSYSPFAVPTSAYTSSVCRVVVPIASQGLTQVAMTMNACEAG